MYKYVDFYVWVSDLEMRLITIHIPESYLEQMDLLVLHEEFPSRGQLIRYAVRQFFRNLYLDNNSLQRILSSKSISDENIPILLKFLSRKDEPLFEMYFRNRPEILNQFLEKCVISLDEEFSLLL